MDAKNIHTMLVTSQKKFIVEPSRLHATECFLGRGIFNTDGLSWKQAHLASKPIFARAQISNLDILEERLDVLLAMIPHDGTTVNLLPLLKRLFLDTSTLLKTTKDRVSLRSQLLNIFLPARDQTAIAAGNIFFNLARHPEVWNRLQNEVSNYDEPLTYESLKQMMYAKTIVNESLRILAPSGRSIRSCGEDCILPTGGGPDGIDPVLVVRGTEVNYIFRSMHLDKNLWGADADEFRPERWEKLGTAQNRAYIPFSKGDRVCPAQQMVLNECLYILVRVAKTFQILENRDPEERFVE
ncbi:hypothetical protein BTUL_0086g00380 [Botrytis tulipae]|uniref:Cytochrome P450 alkane hydroxylase n=1 Tax=Botrytis tulipae TaxID=87230 RepID=A0A4Z1EQA2_9HELO|nr:hypothetical protein BTUL_0086g00380 [Botrytis tulipae]